MTAALSAARAGGTSSEGGGKGVAACSGAARENRI